MEVQDSAQRIARTHGHRSRQPDRAAAGDSLRISMRLAMPLCVFSDVHSLAFHHALGGMCLCSFTFRPVTREARGAAPFWRGSSSRPRAAE
jgi:hypothetical protein